MAGDMVGIDCCRYWEGMDGKDLVRGCGTQLSPHSRWTYRVANYKQEATSEPRINSTCTIFVDKSAHSVWPLNVSNEKLEDRSYKRSRSNTNTEVGPKYLSSQKNLLISCEATPLF